MKPKSLLVAAGAVCGVAAAVATAWGFWTGSGNGVGSGASGSLNAPTSVTATMPNSLVRTVHVTWVIPTTPDNSAPSGFTVARSDGSTTSAACGTGSTPLPGSSTSCDDTSVPS